MQVNGGRIRLYVVLSAFVVAIIGSAFFAFPSSAASATRVQEISNANSGGETVSVTWPSATTADNLLIAIVSYEKGSDQTITPPAGGWTLAQRSDGSSNLGTALYYIENATSQAGESTWVLGSGAGASLVLMEYSGLETTDVLDQTAANNGNGTAVDSGATPATTQDDELAIASLTVKKMEATFSGETNGFSEVLEVDASSMTSVIEEKNISAIGMQDVTATSSESESWVGLIVTFKIQASGPGGGSGLPGLGAETIIPQFPGAEVAESCVTSSVVNLSLTARDAVSVLVGNNSFFHDAQWQSFSDPATLSWELSPGTGDKTIYVLFRSQTSNFSTLQTVNIFLDEEDNCGLPVEEIVEEAEEEEIVEEMVEEVEEVQACIIDCGDIRYDLYVTDGTGNERHIQSRFALVEESVAGVTKIGYEVTGDDFDFDDMVFEVDSQSCSTFSATITRAEVQNDVRLRILDNGFEYDVLLFSKDEVSEGRGKSFSYASLLCPVGTEPEILSGNVSLIDILDEGVSQETNIGSYTVFEGRVQDTSAGTSSFIVSLLSEQGDKYIGATITFLSGPLAGQYRTIYGFEVLDGTILVDFPFDESPLFGDRFIVTLQESIAEFPDLPEEETLPLFVSEEVAKSALSQLNASRVRLAAVSELFITTMNGQLDLQSTSEYMVTESDNMTTVIDSLPFDSIAKQSLLELVTVHDYDIVDERSLLSKYADIQAMVNALQAILQTNGKTPIVESYLSYGSVDFNYIFINPLEISQRVEIHDVLPREVKSEHVLQDGGFELSYENEAEHFNVDGILTLEPGAVITRTIVVEDVWIILEKDLTALLRSAVNLHDPISKTLYAGFGLGLFTEIEALVDAIKESQSDLAVLPQFHIASYRENQVLFERAESNVQGLKELLPICVAGAYEEALNARLNLTIGFIALLIILFGGGTVFFGMQGRLQKSICLEIDKMEGRGEKSKQICTQMKVDIKKEFVAKRNFLISMLFLLLVIVVTILFWIQGLIF